MIPEGTHEALWDDASENPGDHSDTISVVEDRRGSVVVLPGRSRRAAAACLVRHTGDMGVLNRTTRRAASLAVSLLGTGPLRPQRRQVSVGPGSLNEHIEGLLGHDVFLAASFGPPRTNRKPVLRVFDPAGTTVAFGKLGWDPLTVRLIETEAAFLQSPARDEFCSVVAPSVLSVSTWNDDRLALFTSELGRPGRVRPTGQIWNELAGAPTDGAGYFSTTLSLLANTNESWTARAVAIVRDAMPKTLVFGRWHGDFTPWNVARHVGDGVVVWDWERAASPVPRGFDVLHFIAQPAWRHSMTDQHTVLAAAEQHLDDLGVVGEVRDTVFSLYLVEMLLRHHQARHIPSIRLLTESLEGMLGTGA